ncbi:MAG TPA: hypothetical protein VGD87_00165, partial [Archangium sp.]
MGTPQHIALVEDLASLVLSVDPDEAGFTALTLTLRELVTKAIAAVSDLKGIAPREALKAVTDACSALQKLVNSDEAPAEAASSPPKS